jgi:hypothetical protein
VTAVSTPHLDAALRIELCRESDVPALMEFIATEWRPDHVLGRDEPLLRWQFAPSLLRGQRAPGPTVMLAWLDGAIVGMLGLTGFDLNLFGERGTGIWLSHWFAAPAHRRRNVALRLMWAARDLGLDAVATLGANEVSAKLLARLGLESIGSLARWVGVFDVAAAAGLMCDAAPALGRDAAASLCRRHLIKPEAGAESSNGLRPAGWSGATATAWDGFWNAVLAPQLVGAQRDSAYLTWRYLSHPRFDYRLCCAERASDGAVEGIAVWRIEQVRDRPIRVLRIVEFLGSAAAEGVLVRAVLDAARDAGAAVGDFYCASPRVARPLAQAGFALAPTDAAGGLLPSRFQPLESQYFPMTTLLRLPGAWRGRVQDLLDEGRLYITKSDGDQDRPTS